MRVLAPKMRVSHKMDKVITKVRNNEPYRDSPGTFLLDGAPVTRASLYRARSLEHAKIVYCGTCGGLLCTENNPGPTDEMVPAIQTCAKCQQVRVHDSGYDDEPVVVQLFQDWRIGRVLIQNDTLKRRPRPAPAPPTPPLRHEYSPLFDELHPINLNRSPVRRYPDGSLHTPGKRKEKQHKSTSELGRLSASNVLQTELVDGQGWFTSKQVRSSTPSKAYVKWANGFGYQEEYKSPEKVLQRTHRVLLPSAEGHRRVQKQQTATLPLSSLSYVGVQFSEQAWSGFAPHDAAKHRQPRALSLRKLGERGVREDKTPRGNYRGLLPPCACDLET